ncbi:MAG: flagellar biosynthesis protein FlhF [Pseudomonadota bacterium]
MNIKRFIAPDMRQALRLVRETLGADAVILSNKSIEGGVEIVAALDLDEATAQAATRPPVKPSSPLPAPTAVPAAVAWSAPRRPVEPRPIRANPPAPVPPAVPRPTPPAPIPETLHAAPRQSPRIEVPADSAMMQEMRHEMRSLRRMMESEFSELSWRELGRTQPDTREVLRRLLHLELHPALCRKLIEQIQDMTSVEQGFRRALAILATAMPIYPDDLLDLGGTVALVGPAGVGKTTSIAKLAARFALRHGSRQLALITTDKYRIGAEEQLHTYARILDVPVRVVTNLEQINSAINAFSNKRLVLIDTAGMSQQDVRLSEQFHLLTEANHPVRVLLTLAANTQLSALEKTLRVFSEARPDGCVVTKTDEAGMLGGMMSLLVRHRLPLAYTTDGQKVPEDMHIARAHTLVAKALELSKGEAEDYGEDYYAMTLASVRPHAHA